MPVVSQSIMKLMVPVGASTVTWALRTPCTSAMAMASSQAWRAASCSVVGHGIGLGDAVERIAVHVQHVARGGGVGSVAGEGAEPCRDAAPTCGRPRRS